MEALKQVSKKEFYNTIMPLDAVMRVVGKYPYTVEWFLRSGKFLGKSVDSGRPLPKTTYYLV